MSSQQFDIREAPYQIYWQNWRSWVDVVQAPPKRFSCGLVCLVFNNTAGLEKLCRSIGIPETPVDLIVVDNHSNETNWGQLRNLATKFPQIAVVRTIANLGGAGGVAVGVEWALARSYESIVLCEEDCEPIHPRFLHELLREQPNRQLVRTWFENAVCKSFSFHFSGFPAKLLELTRGPDPRFFMRGDDLEFALRVKKASEFLGIGEVTLREVGYRHPLIKPTRSAWPFYFRARNMLWILSQHRSLRRLFREVLVVVVSMWSIVIYRCHWHLARVWFQAVVDFLLRAPSFELNQSRLAEFRGILLKAPTDVLPVSVGLKELGRPLDWSIVDSLLATQLGQPRRSWWTALLRDPQRPIAVTGFYGPSYSLCHLAKRLVIIEEVTPNGEIVSGYGGNPVVSWRYSRFALVILLTFVTMMGAAVPIVARFCYLRMRRTV